MKYCNINVTRLKNLTIRERGEIKIKLGNRDIYFTGLVYSPDYSDNNAFRALVDKVSIYDIEGLRTKIREIVRSHS
jgi:hypothetical protein